MQEVSPLFMADVLQLPLPVTWTPVHRRPWQAGHELWQLTRRSLLFVSVASLYLAIGAYLVFHSNLIMGDAFSRVGMAMRILYSRDPHVAAIGFVWGPLPVVAMLPLTFFRGIWPALVSRGFASNVTSALFMAGAVYQMHGLLREMRVTRVARIGLTAAFALHPMIVFSGANGMPEALTIFLLVMAIRQLARWLETDEIAPKAYMGIYLALGYLVRYDVGAAGGAAIVLAAAVGGFRARGTWRQRSMVGVTDAFIVGAPFVFTFVLWAAMSWLFVGHAFEQLTSSYGTALQLKAQVAEGNLILDSHRMLILATQVLVALDFFLGVFVVLGLVGAWRRRDIRPFAVLWVLGPVVLFMFVSYVTGTILPSMRYLIVAIPLGIVMAGYALAPARDGAPSVAGQTAARRWAATGLTATVVGMATLSVPIATAGMVSNQLNHSEAYALQAAISRGRLTPEQMKASRRFVVERQVAAYVDSLHLKRGAVLVDDFVGFAVVQASSRSDQFIIPSDRDFKASLSDLAGSGVQYLLVPAPNSLQLGSLDAVNSEYAHVYDTGAGLGVLDRTFIDHSGTRDDWRIYRVTPPNGSTR
jgi:hypothetical protein